MQVRPEKPEDQAAIWALNKRAFGTAAESNLITALREEARPVISLVAEKDGEILGHIMFSPVALPGQPEVRIMALAPMAVLPERQRKGIGSALVRAGVRACKELGAGAIVLVGHPEYYPRFGFRPAASFGISCEYEVSEEAFMLLELRPGYMAGVSGEVKYHAAFNKA